MLMYNRFGPWQGMRTMCGVLIWTRSILCLVPGTLGQCKVCLLFKVGHFKRKSSSAFAFGTDVKERFCFFTPIHMEGKTFFGSIKSTRSHNAMAFWLAQDCREHSIFVFSDGDCDSFSSWQSQKSTISLLRIAVCLGLVLMLIRLTNESRECKKMITNVCQTHSGWKWTENIDPIYFIFPWWCSIACCLILQ